MQKRAHKCKQLIPVANEEQHSNTSVQEFLNNNNIRFSILFFFLHTLWSSSVAFLHSSHFNGLLISVSTNGISRINYIFWLFISHNNSHTFSLLIFNGIPISIIQRGNTFFLANRMVRLNWFTVFASLSFLRGIKRYLRCNFWLEQLFKLSWIFYILIFFQLFH